MVVVPKKNKWSLIISFLKGGCTFAQVVINITKRNVMWNANERLLFDGILKSYTKLQFHYDKQYFIFFILPTSSILAEIESCWHLMLPVLIILSSAFAHSEKLHIKN